MFEREFSGLELDKEIQKATKSAKAGMVCRFLTGVIILLVCFFEMVPAVCFSQWRNLIHIPGDVIYFIDVPGQPKIGFAGFPDGLNAELFKTSDGGQSWRQIILPQMPETYISNITDIIFKDSLTGWMSVWSGSRSPSISHPGSCLKTTDGGETWSFLASTITIENAYGVHFDKKSDGLFLSAEDGEVPGTGNMPLFFFASWDEGLSWIAQPYNSGFGLESGGFAFTSDDSGILASNDSWSHIWYSTANAGLSWNPMVVDSQCWQPLAIQGTQTYFANTINGAILRTDDSWNTYKVIYQFPMLPSDTNPTAKGFWTQSTSCIRGDINNLIIQAGPGCYRSTDQGLSWNYLCGPGWTILYNPWGKRFYVKGNLIYCAAATDTDWSIWFLNLDSLNLISANFSSQFTSGAKQEGIHPGDTAYVQFRSTDTLGANVAVDSVFLWCSYDTGNVSPISFQPPAGWEIASLQKNPGSFSALIIDTSGALLDSSRNLLTVAYQTWLASSLSTKIYLDSVHTYGHRLNCDCAVSSILSADTATHSLALDSVEILFTGCGDSLLLEAMQGQLPFSVIGIQPNPANTTITVEHTTGPLSIIDPLGRSYNIQQTGNTIDISSLAPGVYFVSDGLSRGKFVKE